MKFSTLARPPIQPAEAAAAAHSICPYHNGLVAETGDVEGRVFYCPIGKEFWRYSRRANAGFYAPLPYGPTGVV